MERPSTRAMPRYLPTIAIAAILFLLASTGGAVAGSLITGKQIKDNTVTTKDIKNGTLKTQDLSPAARHGMRGARGFSAWDTIPSGVTVTGRFFDQNNSPNPVVILVHNVEFPAKAPTAPTGMGFGNDAIAATTTDPACTGSYVAPTAPAGHICVYMNGLSGITSASVDQWVEPAQRPYTWFLAFTPTTAGAFYTYWGSWAYTAP